MREFEILPTEREIMLLAKEYNSVKIRQDILTKQSLIADKTEKKKKYISIPSDSAFEILCCTKRLYSLSPYHLRPDIRKIIKIKQADMEYFSRTDNGEFDAPKTYCSMLDYVIGLQNSLIFSLSETECPNKLITNEMIAMQGYQQLCIYCNSMGGRTFK